MISELENSQHKPHEFECLAQETGIQRDHKEHNKITKSYRITGAHYLLKKYDCKLTFFSFDIKLSFFVRGC